MEYAEVAYGKGKIKIPLDPALAKWKVIRPKDEAPLENAEAKFREACANPTGGPALKGLVKRGEKLVITTSDNTRPVPNKLLIPWILKELDVPDQDVTILLGNGSHKALGDKHLEEMFGIELMKRIKILNHDAFNPDELVQVGTFTDGAPIKVSKFWKEADKKIALGFIEPHFFAGFSGGGKAVVPGLASIDTIFHIHRAWIIGHPMSAWGVLDGNPLREEVEHAVSFCPPDFMVNVTLNLDKKITAFAVGDYVKAHRAGCAKVKSDSMIPVDEEFPIVVTSNSGYPLDQNLYQTVKGISAAQRIVKKGGVILVASECSDGVPNHGNFAAIMKEGDSASDILKSINERKETIMDQWQAQVLVVAMQKARIRVHTKLDKDTLESCKLEACDLLTALNEEIAKVGKGCKVAILPDGPLTIPYVLES